MRTRLFKTFSNLRIRRKLMFVFIIILAMTIITTSVGVVALLNTRREFSYIITYPLDGHQQLSEAKYDMMSVRWDYAMMAALAGEEDELDAQLFKAERSIEEFIRNIQAARRHAQNDPELDPQAISSRIKDFDYLLSGARTLRDDYLTPFYKLMIENELSHAEVLEELNKGFAVVDEFCAKLDDMINATKTRMLGTQSEADMLAARLLWLQIGLAITVALLTVILAFELSNIISKPITKLVEVASDVAEGNLNVTLETSATDETGILAESFERVIDIINMFVRDLRAIDRAFRIDGDTTVRLDVTNYNGAYAEVAAAVNDVLEYHVVSKKEILECISRIVGGEHDAPLRRFPGYESRINDAVDNLRTSVRALEQLIKQKAEAESVSNAKTSFLANMSHEIRTPMNSILGITELLLGDESLPEEIKQGLVTIFNSGTLLIGIINDILDFSKIEAGKLDIVPAEYEIASLINDSTQLHMIKTENRPINFELEIDDNIPAIMIGDELRIKEILNNLLSNAFKYTDVGRVTLTVSFERNEDEYSNITLILGVHDTGFGMTPKQIESLFSEYTRFDQNHGKTIEGTGLGLAITKRLIDLMGGDIHVESAPGEGSSFIARLPQGSVGDKVIGKEVADNLQKFKHNYIESKKLAKVKRDPMPYGSVLIVDDVEPNLYVAVGIMKLYKMNIDTAMSGKEAIEKLKEGNEYDVIFMDHMMPEMDGIEAVRRIRDMGYDKPIVALSANAISGQTSIFLKNGFDDFISKPIDTRRLNEILNKHVRDIQPPEVVEAARQAEEDLKMSEAAADGSAFERMSKALSTDIYGIDVDKGLEKLGGDEESYLMTLRAYATTIRAMLETIEHVDEENIDSYKITVHGIKGASYDIFANTAGKMAESLEKAARNREIEYISMSNATFIYSVKKVIGNIEELLAEVDAEKSKPLKDKPDAGALSRLLAACKACDMDGTDAAMAEIDGYKYESDGDLVDWLRENVSLMKFKKIVEKLES